MCGLGGLRMLHGTLQRLFRRADRPPARIMPCRLRRCECARMLPTSAGGRVVAAAAATRLHSLPSSASDRLAAAR